MPRKPLPGDSWFHARAKLTKRESLALKADGLARGEHAAGLVTRLLRAYLARIPESKIKAMRSLTGGTPPASKGSRKAKRSHSKKSSRKDRPPRSKHRKR